MTIILVPTRIGIKCRRCRFLKCLEIGMVVPPSIMYRKKHKLEVQVTTDIAQQPSPMPLKTNAEESLRIIPSPIQAHVLVATTDDILNAIKIHCLIMPSFALPGLLINYLEDDTPTLLNIALTAPIDENLVSRVSLVLTGHEITIDELPFFCYLVICLIKIPNLTEQQHVWLQYLQQRQYTKYYIEGKYLAQPRINTFLSLALTCLSFY